LTQAATIREQGTHTYWACPNCRRVIAEIVGVRLIIIVKLGRESKARFFSLPLIDDMQMSCDRCGQVSVYRDGKRGAA